VNNRTTAREVEKLRLRMGIDVGRHGGVNFWKLESLKWGESITTIENGVEFWTAAVLV
jgi:hypothetical protein